MGNRAILLSIKPEYVAAILNGYKTIEFRKLFPIDKDYMDVYIYCTKQPNKNLVINDLFEGDKYWVTKNYKEFAMNGKVVAKFKIWKIKEIECEFHKDDLDDEDGCYQAISEIVRDEEFPEEYDRYELVTNEDYHYDQKPFLVQSCLKMQEIKNYMRKNKNEWFERAYAIYIHNLVIFDRPKELKEFFIYSHTVDGVNEKNKATKYDVLKKLTNAPQNYCYIEVD